MLGGSTMYNFLGCKILQGPHPAAWDQEDLPFRQIPANADWNTPFSVYHPMHLPAKTNVPSVTCHAPFNNLVLCPDYFSGTRLQCTFHLHIYAMYTLQGDTSMMLQSYK